MGFPRRIASLFRNLFRKPRVERELDDELRTYVEQLTEEKLAAGMPPDRAARAARMELGMEQVKEQVRDAHAGALLEQFAADLRFGARLLLKNRSFALVAVLTLALGIGATTAVFSVVYGVLLRPLPYDQPGRIVQLSEIGDRGQRMRFTDPNFEDIRAQSRSFQEMAEYAWWVETVGGASQATRTSLALVSHDFFTVMRVEPVLGRAFAPDDQHFGAAPVALVSYAYWQQFLGATKDLTHISLKIENRTVSVIGVLPPGFRFPDGDIWIPRELEEVLQSRTAHNWYVIGRLREGASLAQARAELSGLAHRLKQQYGRDTNMIDVAASPLREAVTRETRPALLVLLGAVAFLLLIACGNVANLLLAQATARQRELAVRAALGAERRRLVRQFLTEALLLSLVGGSCGVLAAFWGVRAMLALAPHNLPRLEEVGISLPALLFALAVSAAVAATLGIATALRATQGDPRDALASGSRAEAGTIHSRHQGGVLAGAQLAITLALLVGAGLLGRSLLRLLAVDPGFRIEHILTVDLAPPANAGPSSGTVISWLEQERAKVRRAQFLDTLLTRLRSLPGVREIGVTGRLPLASDCADGTYILMSPAEPQPRMKDLDELFHQTARTGYADYCAASEDYFRALGIPLVRGRLFDDRDTMDAPHVAVVSESLARKQWPNQDPLGHTIEFGNMDGDLRLLTIVGIVGDVREASLEKAPRPTVYVNYRQRPPSEFTVVLHTDAAPAEMIPAIRKVLHDLDPNLPPQFSTFAQVFSASLQARRFNLTLVGVFAGTALLLALAGIYGVMAYAVARRTREIGVRMALGADGGSVLRLVLGQGMRTAVIGVLVGLAGSFLLTRTMQSLLFGVSADDPVTFAGVATLLTAVAALACYVPARRATRVEPTVALRYE